MAYQLTGKKCSCSKASGYGTEVVYDCVIRTSNTIRVGFSVNMLLPIEWCRKTKKEVGIGPKYMIYWAVVVAQLVEQLLLTTEVEGLNPVIGKLYTEHLFTVNCIEMTKIMKKWLGMAR